MVSHRLSRCETAMVYIRAASRVCWGAMNKIGEMTAFAASEIVERFAEDAIALHPELFCPPSEFETPGPPLE